MGLALFQLIMHGPWPFFLRPGGGRSATALHPGRKGRLGPGVGGASRSPMASLVQSRGWWGSNLSHPSRPLHIDGGDEESPILPLVQEKEGGTKAEDEGGAKRREGMAR